MDYVKLERNGGIVTITIDNEKAMNALNMQALREIREAAGMIDESTDRCVVITGAGKKSFVAGADIKEMKDISTEEGRELAILGNSAMRAVETIPVPTVAAVNGYALGGGCELACACDIRIGSENAVFGQPETGIGITPLFGGTQRLPRVIGLGKAKEIIFSGVKIKADEALRIGLLNAVYPIDELMEKAYELAGKIAANSPIGVRRSKAAINEGMQVGIEDAMQIEIKHAAVCFGTEDQHAAMNAFAEKRKLDGFKNR